MKNSILALITILAFFSCNSNDDNQPVELVGTWLLIEQYSDPGDGSGDYTAVNSDKAITFLVDGTITSNGSFCSMNSDSDGDTAGTFNVLDNVINPNDCSSSDYTLPFEIKGNRLFIYYPCIEGCGQKFRKV